MKERIKGKGAVGIAVSYFSLRGMVSIPIEPCDYNLIYHSDDDHRHTLFRRKVISCSYQTKYGVFSASIRTSGGNQPNSQIKEFDPLSCDYVFIVTSELDMYLIPSEDIHAKRQISLNAYGSYKVNLIPE